MKPKTPVSSLPAAPVFSIGERLSSAKPAKRQSDQAFEILYRAIVRCEIMPGATVSEAQLAERFGLARASARAAVDRLSIVGMLRPVHRRGYIVKPITLRDVNDLFQLRTIIEVAGNRLAAGRVDEFSLRRLDRACSKRYRLGDRESESKFLQANSEFHLTVVMVSGNDRLVAALAQILNEMERLIHIGLALRNRSEEIHQEHQALIDALVKGDADEVERLTREELAASKSMVLDSLMSSPDLRDVSISFGRTDHS
jgi:DNA-binding GntR family transcriptional regulator